VLEILASRYKTAAFGERWTGFRISAASVAGRFSLDLGVADRAKAVMRDPGKLGTESEH
jgi:hypothetical protein